MSRLLSVSSPQQPPEPAASVRFILADESHYGDGPPQWLEGRSQRRCETAAQAEAERRRQVKRLRRYGKKNPAALAVAARLSGCLPQRRCHSGACPECARAWQRWFVTATSRFLTETSSGEQSTILSPVHPEGLVEHGELNP